MYRTLDIEKIVDTITALERRICERFEGAGLARVCGDYRMPDASPELQAAVSMLAPGGAPGTLCGAQLGFTP